MGRENAASRAENWIRLECLEIPDRSHVVAVEGVVAVAAHMMAGHGRASR